MRRWVSVRCIRVLGFERSGRWGRGSFVGLGFELRKGYILDGILRGGV